jgi:hypothetical protein
MFAWYCPQDSAKNNTMSGTQGSDVKTSTALGQTVPREGFTCETQVYIARLIQTNVTENGV